MFMHPHVFVPSPVFDLYLIISEGARRGKIIVKRSDGVVWLGIQASGRYYKSPETEWTMLR